MRCMAFMQHLYSPVGIRRSRARFGPNAILMVYRTPLSVDDVALGDVEAEVGGV